MSVDHPGWSDDPDPSAPPSNDRVWLERAVKLSWYARRRPLFTGGNEVMLLRGGLTMFPRMLADIENARESIWLVNYLTALPGMPGRLLEALARAAERGVKVKVVVDGVGSKDVPEAFWNGLRARGVEVAVFRPIRGLVSLVFNSSNWRRMHLKLCVIDGQWGYVGGINLIDDHYDPHEGWSSAPRLDYAVRLGGPVLTPIEHTARAMWTRALMGHDWREEIGEWLTEPGKLRWLKARWREARLRLTPEEMSHLLRQDRQRQPVKCAFVLRDNLRQRRTIEKATLGAIGRARERIDLVTPYFYPGRALKRALKEAARRGVRVRLLLQGRWDYRVAAVAARVLYEDLLLAGIEIHEYQPSWLHAKVACIDHHWAMVGSSNLDPLSLLLNLEGNVIVRDAGFVQQLQASLAADFAQSRQVAAPAGASTSRSWRWRRAVVAWLSRTWLRMAGTSRHF